MGAQGSKEPEPKETPKPKPAPAKKNVRRPVGKPAGRQSTKLSLKGTEEVNVKEAAESSPDDRPDSAGAVGGRAAVAGPVSSAFELPAPKRQQHKQDVRRSLDLAELHQKQQQRRSLQDKLAESQERRAGITTVAPGRSSSARSRVSTTNRPSAATVRIIPKRSALVCAAIDFGTTYTGYGYSFSSKPADVFTHYWENKEIKTPTIVLMDPDKKFHSFGTVARQEYERLMSNDANNKTNIHTKWYLLERFKMKLFVKEQTLDRNMDIEDIHGKSIKAIDVFAAAIRYIKEHLMERINDPSREQRVEIRGESDIHWVLTVPAIWNDLSKRFMRDAAVQAGIPDSMLSLALEPEAASLYCQKSLGLQTIPVGCRYIVLDLGGGTADITCHEVNANGTLKELHQPTGGDFGGTNVDNKFIDILNRIFGANVIRAFKNDYMNEYWELMSDFELKKRNFDGSGRIVLKFPSHLLDLYEGKVGQAVSESLQQSSLEQSVEFKLGKLFIAVDLVKTIFDETVNKIVKVTESLLEKVDRIDNVIMVGGFSESPYLREVMKEKLGNLMIPLEEPSGAVLKGAVIFGHAPGAIDSRICQYTYGIARMEKFKEYHPERKKVVIDGKPHCDDIFDKHIEIGTKVSVDLQDEAKELQYYPSSSDMRHAVLEVYASTEKDPKFTTDDRCHFVGLVKLDIDPKGDYWSKIMVKMLFGGTELLIQAREVKTNKMTIAAVEFWG